MTTQTQTLTDFLLARIAEDEMVARGASAPRPWVTTSGPNGWTNVRGVTLDASTFVAQFERTVDAIHVHRHDPARVLAECEAKRRIVELGDGYRDGVVGLMLRWLALPYADHPDFREEWRP